MADLLPAETDRLADFPGSSPIQVTTYEKTQRVPILRVCNDHVDEQMHGGFVAKVGRAVGDKPPPVHVALMDKQDWRAQHDIPDSDDKVFLRRTGRRM